LSSWPGQGLGLGAGIAVLALLSTGRWALDTAARAAALFEGVDAGSPAGPPPAVAARARGNG
jgi:hypothetical protein